jgi:hypothetical protein
VQQQEWLQAMAVVASGTAAVPPAAGGEGLLGEPNSHSAAAPTGSPDGGVAGVDGDNQRQPLPAMLQRFLEDV